MTAFAGEQTVDVEPDDPLRELFPHVSVVTAQGVFVNGLREGEWLGMNEDGVVSLRCHFVRGKAHGAAPGVP